MSDYISDPPYLSRHESNGYKTFVRQDLANIQAYLDGKLTPDQRSKVLEFQTQLTGLLDVDLLTYEHCAAIDAIVDEMGRMGLPIAGTWYEQIGAWLCAQVSAGMDERLIHYHISDEDRPGATAEYKADACNLVRAAVWGAAPDLIDIHPQEIRGFLQSIINGYACWLEDAESLLIEALERMPQELCGENPERLKGQILGGLRMATQYLFALDCWQQENN